MNYEIKLKEELNYLQKQYFCGVPIQLLDWKETLLQELYEENASQSVQSLLLNNIINHPLLKEYPLKVSYQQGFIKYIIDNLESQNQEIVEELYVAYCDLLSIQDEESGMHYRHYKIDHSNVKYITLEESSRLISLGTTGLCSWQACQALAEWCLSNHQQFQNKHILELGSGVGLMGLVVSLCCKPLSYRFSDCHPSVLNVLKSNISLNISRFSCDDVGMQQELADVESTQNYAKCVTPETKNTLEKLEENDILLNILNNTTIIQLVALRWEEVPNSTINNIHECDIVLAADVVYDPSVFHPLCQALVHLITRGSQQCIAILACTVRNEDTLLKFLELIENYELHVCKLDVDEPHTFVYSRDTPINIYKITYQKLDKS